MDGSRDAWADAGPGSGPQEPADGATTLLVTADPGLADLVAPAAAACGQRLQRAASCDHPSWRTARTVLLDGRIAAGAPTTPAGGDVVVLTGPVVPEAVWRTALEHRARDVVRLPDEAHRLLALLQAATDPDRGGAVVGVVGGRGGAGASVTAAVLATAAAESGLAALLCDVDPLGGGLGLLLGEPDAAGLHWHDLASLGGRLRADALRDAVPPVDAGCGVLTWPPGRSGAVSPDVLVAALGAGRRGHDLVVADLPRRVDAEAAAVLAALDVLLLVVPAEVRAVGAAAALLAAVRPVVADVRLLVRGRAPGGLPARAVADALELPVTMRWPSSRGLAAQLERGEPPGLAGRGALGRAGRVLLHALLAAAPDDRVPPTDRPSPSGPAPAGAAASPVRWSA